MDTIHCSEVARKLKNANTPNTRIITLKIHRKSFTPMDWIADRIG